MAARALRFGKALNPNPKLWITDSGTWPVIATSVVAVGW
jgi:hypothetical protein